MGEFLLFLAELFLYVLDFHLFYGAGWIVLRVLGVKDPSLHETGCYVAGISFSVALVVVFMVIIE